jgi:hypothetical protein
MVKRRWVNYSKHRKKIVKGKVLTKKQFEAAKKQAEVDYNDALKTALDEILEEEPWFKHHPSPR